MIGHLSGVLVWASGNMIIIDVAGVGYYVEVTNSAGLPELGQKIELFIYTYVREESLTLYGFRDMAARELFMMLLGITGIGPKAALNILSTLDYQQFIQAILSENIPVLKGISGIGQKTAQRLILELKSRVDKLAGGLKPALDNTRNEQVLYDALLSLGYSIREIENALSKVKLEPDRRIEDKIKTVLSYLGKGSLA